ncbi:vWA domain-containing protein [Shewanella sp. YLB-07]|uniref:vWA domain-containing protein n=1 Tax=Shewanella sp. YLB-07 TaxID=2601268 RepID=UPI00128E8427|nr:VWA domain-containing protein [Shewanella sp. YLB-07]MPY21520.1 VWA domain-containing protein [Shewanella sp. YLB-07]MPY22307.1 VWA domain-containing protein [Shewanella sp. YLB-07]
MHFLRPEWFFALIPLIILILLLWRSERKNSTWNRYIAPHLASLLVTQTNEIKRSKLWYLGLAWLVAVLALSGPAFTKQSLPVYEAAQGRVIVMDMSLSMYASDLSPNRLSQAKFKATDLIDALEEGETGLIAYAGDAFTISPLTRDRATLLNLLPTLSPDIMPVRGSNLVAALEQGKNLLAQGGHIRGDILLLTDGVSTQQMRAAKAVLQDTQYRLAIMAFGSEQGSPIRLPDGQLLRDNADQVVVAKTNYSLLNELTQAADGVLIPYRSDGRDLEQMQNWLSTTGDTKATELDGEIWQDAGPYIALLLLLPVLLSFRHGLVAVVALFIVYIPTPVQASTWDNLWQTQDQQGMQAYQAEDYQQASDSFTSPQWQASALYKAGEYDEALSLFEQDNSASGLFNQGNSLMQQNKYDEAIKRYQEALVQNPELTGAKDNLELAKKLAQQKQDSPDQDKSDSQEKSEDNADKDSDKDKQQKSDQEQQSQSNDSQQDSASDKEDSGDQSPEDKSSEEKSSENQDSKSKNNDADMQADPDKLPSQKDNQDSEQDKQTNSHDSQEEQEQQARSQNAQAADENPEEEAQAKAQAAQMHEGPEALPPEMERALRSLVDDPQVLLRNKMQLEYQKRARQNANSKDQQQW